MKTIKQFRVPKGIKSEQPEHLKQFNLWAKKNKISSKWVEDTEEKRDIIVRIQEAKFAEAMLKERTNEEKYKKVI